MSNISNCSEKFGQRIQIKCQNLRFRLQVPLVGTESGDTETLRQVEPYITSLALYDAKAGRKLTENFYFDINDDTVSDLFYNPSSTSSTPLQSTTASSSTNSSISRGCDSPTPSQKSRTSQTTRASNDIGGSIGGGIGGSSGPLPSEWRDQLPSAWLRHPQSALFSVTAAHPDIFVVVKIDKILQGGMHSAAEPYLKASKDPKLAMKLHRNALLYSQKIGRFRMPFAWAARPLFRLYSSELDTTADFPAIYRQEANRLRDEDLLRLLAEFRKPDKFSKMTVVPGWLTLAIESVATQPNRKSL